jgi:menaquinol-cytochrome c reductase iron-sulfur subunit
VAEEGIDKQGAPRRLEKPDPPGYFQGESMTRRTAFTVAVQAIGGVAGLAIVLPAVGFAVAPLFEQEKELWQAVGPTGDFSPDTYRPVVITAVQNIGETGKTTAYVRQGNPDPALTQNGKYPAETASEYIAISTRCAHVGCPVRFVQASGNFICPCHGGVYGFLGERIGGPPVRPLDRFQTLVVNGQVQVGPRYSVTNSLDPVRARDPGEFTGGVWNYLYPPRPSVPPPP